MQYLASLARRQRCATFGITARMITVFHILPLMGLVTGVVVGFILGSYAGPNTAIIGGVLGGVVGLLCGRAPLILVLKSIKHDFNRWTTEDLRRTLRDRGFPAPNVILLELRSRGEDLECEIPTVLDMLTDPDQERRMRGWHALETAFPERSKKLSDYRIDDTLEECRRKIQRLQSAETFYVAMSTFSERFSLSVVSALPASERNKLIMEIQTLLNQALSAGQTLKDYQTILYDLIDQLSSLGYHLGRWNYDSEVEIWGRPSYMDAKVEVDLLLRSEFPKGVTLAWKDFEALKP